MDSKDAHNCAQNAEMASALTFTFTFYSNTTEMAMNFSITSYEQQVLKPGFHL
jgi:hypothetical protein